MCGRVLAALKSEALLNESVGAGYIERNWPPALKAEGAWPLASLRQSFLNGSLTRLVDPDAVLKTKIVEFVGRGDFGLASGRKADGTFERSWFQEPVAGDEVAFESGVFLLRNATAEALKARAPAGSTAALEPPPGPMVPSAPEPGPPPGPEPAPPAGTRTLRLSGSVPPRGLEPPRHEDPSKAPSWERTQDRRRFLGDDLRWRGGSSRRRVTPDLGGTGLGRRRPNRVTIEANSGVLVRDM